MRFLLPAILAILAGSGCASLEQRAQSAAIGDTASTGVAVLLGGVEANPIGLLTIPAKLVALEYANALPDGEREIALSGQAAMWTGAAGHNVCVIVGLLGGPASTLGCVAVGVAVTVQQWFATAAYREFHARCEEYKAHVGGSFRCVFRL